MNAAALNYSALCDLLTRARFTLAAPELHGSICGMLCAGGDVATHRWLDDCVGEYAEQDDPAVAAELRQTLHEVASLTSHDLASDDMSFAPLAPDDDTPLDEQVQALAAYCHGFLSGLGLGAGESGGSLDAELREILVDLAEIARAQSTTGDSGEADQADFALAELKEYVRVSVQIVFEELARPDSAAH